MYLSWALLRRGLADVGKHLLELCEARHQRLDHPELLYEALEELEIEDHLPRGPDEERDEIVVHVLGAQQGILLLRSGD